MTNTLAQWSSRSAYDYGNSRWLKALNRHSASRLLTASGRKKPQYCVLCLSHQKSNKCCPQKECYILFWQLWQKKCSDLSCSTLMCVLYPTDAFVTNVTTRLARTSREWAWKPHSVAGDHQEMERGQPYEWRNKTRQAARPAKGFHGTNLSWLKH